MDNTLETYLKNGVKDIAGGAEPCPFSPYSDVNAAKTSLREALNSELFRQLREGGHLTEEHKGGCVLFEKRALVQGLATKHPPDFHPDPPVPEKQEG